ncbi:hypothetical protein Dsin_026528 [Dipteronia sinensis]|uniref:Uncharacterized protein n=1 Tax=Dipteronia sinensis TaxID=43782 RepID=A0AAD9ZZ87_9ROSI|nr:hypothetical protein Dsin_026528 [Dipteronia sinensis]
MSTLKIKQEGKGSTDTMVGFIVHCSGYWKDWDCSQFIEPISFACCLTNKVKDIYSELSEKIYHRIGVSSRMFELNISSQLKTKTREFTLSIKTDDDVTCLLSHKQSDWHEIHVQVVELF